MVRRRTAGLGGLLRVALLTVVVSVDVVFGTWAKADPSSRPSALLSLDMFWQEEISVNFSVLEATRGSCPRTVKHGDTTCSVEWTQLRGGA
jgi:hypothetical protein